MGERFEDFLGDIKETLGQCGAMKTHFSDALTNLEQLKSDLTKKELFSSAKRELNRANKAGRRVSQYFNKVKKTIEEVLIDKQISVDDKKILVGFKERIKPHEASLTLKTSYFVGTLGGEVDSLGIQLDLLRKKKQNFFLVMTELNKLISVIQGIMGGGVTVGLLPFMAEIQNNLLPVAKKIKIFKLKR